MAITAVDKIKINKYLKERAIDEIYYGGLCETLGKKEKITNEEFIEYFTDCVITELNKNKKISTKHLSKIIFLIECILTLIKSSESKIKDETLNKISSFKDFYIDYLKRNNLEIEEEFNDKYIKVVVRIANKLSSEESKKETIIQYINKIKSLEEEIHQLKKQLEQITKEYNKLVITHNKQQKKAESLTDSLNDKIILMKKDIDVKIEEINKLTEELEKVKNKTNDLEQLLSQIQEEKEVLSKYKELYETLTIEFNKLKKIVEEENTKKQQIEELRTRHLKLESLIYRKILFEKMTIDEIISYIKLEGYTSNKEEIIEILKKIKNKINIESNSFSLSPSYKVNIPNIIENNSFVIDIPKDCKYYDIMLVSDFHIKTIDYKVMAGFDKLNEYCIKNNIHLILNLGDFYDGIGGKTLEYSNAIKNYQLIEDSILQLPKSNEIYHAILGGNHDKNISNYGYDPIKILTNEREDFISLGYTHSIINLNNNNNILGTFGIHHPDRFDFAIELDDNGIDCKGLDKYLKQIYGEQSKTKNYTYIDIFGHTHKIQFNYLNSYCYIPSFFEGQSKRGACHLRIYFEDNKEIKYMVFMPITINSQLIKNNEIIYKKVLSK